MVPCPTCARHIQADAACPFCASPRTSKWMQVVGAVVTPVMLAACYGGPAYMYDDVDGDGFTEMDGDCDDDNATVTPEAAEVCDNTLDDDCDGYPDGDDTDCGGAGGDTDTDPLVP